MEKPTRYMFVCYAAQQRSPTAVDVSLNLAAHSGMNLEACCFGTNYLAHSDDKAKFKKYQERFLKQDRIFVMASDMTERMTRVINIPPEKIICFNIPDNYVRGGLDLRNKLKTRITPWIIPGDSYPYKKYLVLSLIDCKKAHMGVEAWREKIKRRQKRSLVDYAAIDWRNISKECREALVEEEFYDKIIVFEDKIFDTAVVKEPLIKTLACLAKNPDKFGRVDILDPDYRDPKYLKKKIMREIERQIRKIT